MTSIVHNQDCMIGMKQYPDKWFDLAVVDPPYGIGADKMKMGTGKQIWSKNKNWDNTVPNQEYFNELFRVSKNQIIWGGNYFNLPKTGGWIFWDKELNKDISFGDGELAWTNFLTTIKKIIHQYSGFLGADQIRIHPTQKPIGLYEKLFKNYAKEGDKILDTHVGSGSIRIAADKAGFDFTGYEIDKDYWADQEKRYKDYKSQLKLF